MYKHILVPVDGSAQSERGLDEAIKLAHAMQGRIRLIHAFNDAPLARPGLTGEHFDSVYEQVRGDGARLLGLAAAYVSKAGVTVDTKLIETPKARLGDLIAREAEEWPADLVVCSTHGRSGLLRALLGSDGEEILRRSPVPVLLVPTHPACPPACRTSAAEASEA